MLKKTLIVDLDGTVLKCGRYYNASAQAIAESMEQRLGVPAHFGRELLEWLDVWAIRVAHEHGTAFSRDRYPRVSAAAVAAAEMITTSQVSPEHLVAAFKRAEQVFGQHEEFDGALATLAQYRDAGWYVVIYTKGDLEVQQAKIYKSGVDKVVNGWHVTNKKDTDTLMAFCQQFEVDISTSVYVGDSLRDDMTPARCLGILPVRVTAHVEDAWKHDAADNDDMSAFVIEALRDLPTVVSPTDGNLLWLGGQPLPLASAEVQRLRVAVLGSG